MLIFIYFYNIHCWKNITINVDLYILFQHSLLKEYNNKCCSLYTFSTFIVERIQQWMLFFIYFFNIHYWNNTTINVVLYILFQYWLLEEYNNKCCSLYTFTTLIVEKIKQYMLFIFNIYCWKNTTINVDLYILLNNEC